MAAEATVGQGCCGALHAHDGDIDFARELASPTKVNEVSNAASLASQEVAETLVDMKTLDDWLAKIVEEEARQLSSAVAIECVLNLQGQEVPFDPSRLQRAIINLLSNAAEAMVGKGDDPSRFETKFPKILVQTDVLDGFALIKIKDNGPGISAENLEKIREPLFTTKSFGTGLGLPAVEQIATQHSGRLEINSKLGAGAEFIIYLPLNSETEAVA